MFVSSDFSFFSYIFNKNKRKKLEKKFKYCIYVIISTIPVGITGFIFKDKLENMYSLNGLASILGLSVAGIKYHLGRESFVGSRFRC